MSSLTYATLAQRGLFGISGLVLVLFIVYALAAGGLKTEDFVFIGPIILIPIAVGLALRRWSGKTNLVATLIGLLLILFNIPFTALANPGSTLDFTFTAIGLFGGIIVIVASVNAFLGRNLESPPSPSPVVRSAFMGMVALPALVSVAGLAIWVGGGSDIDDADRAAATAVDIADSDFAPKEIDASTGTLVVSNSDLSFHTFTIEALDIDVPINPGREAIVDLTGSPAGSYSVICTVLGHDDMGATVVIQ